MNLQRPPERNLKKQRIPCTVLVDFNAVLNGRMMAAAASASSGGGAEVGVLLDVRRLVELVEKRPGRKVKARVCVGSSPFGARDRVWKMWKRCHYQTVVGEEEGPWAPAAGRETLNRAHRKADRHCGPALAVIVAGEFIWRGCTKGACT